MSQMKVSIHIAQSPPLPEQFACTKHGVLYIAQHEFLDQFHLLASFVNHPDFCNCNPIMSDLSFLDIEHLQIISSILSSAADTCIRSRHDRDISSSVHSDQTLLIALLVVHPHHVRNHLLFIIFEVYESMATTITPFGTSTAGS